MIHVIATITIAQGKADEFLEHFWRLVPLVREEEGCLEYGPTRDAKTDIAKQHTSGDNVIVIIERWTSLDALKAHLAAPHMSDYRHQVSGLVEGSQLQIFEPAIIDSTND